MDMELELELELEGVQSEGFFQSQSLLIQEAEAEAEAAGANSSASCIAAPQKRVRSRGGKTPTRQWAAWTHEEERSFFNALRQVGKNFEKITSRIESKNKDQVRHYYYRLVRRMNKLLGPDFLLDARNFKETNGAMLRWSALLEKYNCKASKLHLKPRRFKIIVEALEQQLLKDRKKYIKKRPSQGGKCSTTTPDTVSLQNIASAADIGAVKGAAAEIQNVQKVGSGRGSSVKRNVNTGINRKNKKCDLSTVKTVKQRKKTGSFSSAAYKKWEKAAIAGVSLVADAAEHLERTTISKENSPDRRCLDESFPVEAVTTEKGNGPFGVSPLLPFSTSLQTQVPDTCIPPNFAKLKLQLFPIDEDTRRALEKDEHNPFLELTLSARKKISSVLEHLNRKWGNSSIASGELMLFQYDAQRGNLVRYQRWKQDTVASAADVYTVIGSPPLFRLRYGWFSPADLTLVSSGVKEQPTSSTAMPPLHDCHTSYQFTNSSEYQQTQIIEKNNVVPCCYTDLTDDTVRYNGMDHENIIEDIVHFKSWPGKESGRETIQGPRNDGDNLRRSNNTTISAGDWADSLTNISIGELLVDQPQAMGTNNFQPAAMDSSALFHQIPFSCDSFDAAIAAHIYGNRDKQDPISTQVSHASSIWDAEETCDAFSFQKITRAPILAASSGTSRQTTDTSAMVNRSTIEELPNVHHTDANPTCEVDLINNNPSDKYKVDDYPKDLGGLTDLYWPESLGPLDLDVPASRYPDQDLMLGDSISLTGLNRLIASSLDAFQNCTFFGLDKKEQPSPTTEARGTAAPFLDCKIGGEV
ncbi:hypothetical protein MKW94_000275 [Papaver nudicaule]|uniref:TSL-kinase interacting protein 1 n=1 Tax=Papaver nudicaule TaxID=74823 RepID=A0AA42B122_PAPNU|nr:hypothetical protein [Papaver nudicaule]